MTTPATNPPPDTTADAEPRVERNDDENRYDILVGDDLAGFTEYRIDTHGRLVFTHTEVDPAFEGRGLAGILVRTALRDVAARNETIVPRCPYVVRWLGRHDVDGLQIVWPNEPGFVR
ncbi:GNAT family N-acetyltransferase [uncultured Microbacterium sp.]|uniref:GNAT family N-acetyltransferase n=1 Tax=uncultured Microbacterium sp. TaxID=191216 RepID=UPI0028D7FFF5|nr:GNAT family N-acetyltransferase [uncultured Microbacterium sp.]